MAVREGQVLARLDDATSRAALALAEAQAEAARRAVRENEVRLAEAKRVARARAAAGQGSAVHAGGSRQARRRKSIRSTRAFARCASRCAWPSGRSSSNGPISTTRSSARRSAAWRSPRMRSPGEMVSPVSAGGGFTRTGICTIVDMRSLEIEVDVNESYINRVKPDQTGHRDPECVSRLADSGARHHDGAGRRSPEGDRAGAHRLRRLDRVRVGPNGEGQGARSADPAGHGREGDVSAKRRRRAPAATTQAQPVTLVPKAAIRTEGEQAYAFVVAGETAERRAVRTGGDRRRSAGGRRGLARRRSGGRVAAARRCRAARRFK